MIHIYTGDGKGKTTAGVGLAVRFAGSGQKVLYAQFMKAGNSSEIKVLQQIPGITLADGAKCFGFSFQMSEETKKEAFQYYTEYFQQMIKQAAEEKCCLLVLDEILVAYEKDLIDRAIVLNYLRGIGAVPEVVLTGRGAAPELIELADYVSEIEKKKHPFDKGIEARIGIEM